MTLKFDIVCKKCGSKDVSLWGYCGQNYGEGVLTCNSCNEEESSTETDD